MTAWPCFDDLIRARCLLPVKGYAYFTDWRLGGIVRVRKTDGGEMVTIRRGISHIMHVKSFNSNSQIGECLYSLSFSLYSWLQLTLVRDIPGN